MEWHSRERMAQKHCMRRLIDNISQVLVAASINVSNTIENWYPYIEEAQETFIRPVLGKDLYDQLQDTVLLIAGTEQNKPPIEVKMTDLLERIRKPLALYALWLGADEFGVSVSSQGIQVIETTTHKTAPQYRVQNLKENWIRRANTALDLALKFLPTLSPQLFDELKTARRSDDPLGVEYSRLLALIRPALAHLAMARALQEIAIDFLDWGIFDTAGNTFANVSSKQASNKERIAVMYEANLRDGEAELKALQQFLDENASETLYPSYFHSSRYVGIVKAESRNEFINKSTNSYFLA